MAEAKRTTKKTKTSEIVETVKKEHEHGTTQETNQVHDQDGADQVASELTAKAGKRSAKSLREAAEKQAKEARKAHSHETEDKPKPVVKPARSRLERRGKKFREVAQKIERGKLYSPADALELATQTSPVSFDATVELHVNLNIDPHKADQNVRDSLVLPAGTGKSVRVAVFSDDAVNGADVSGTESIIKNLERGLINFDVLIASPATMARLGKYARLLGPRGLMPNPKSGTVTSDVAKAVAEAKAGRVEYRVDSTGIVHVGIGKVSFGKDRLLDNFQALISSIKASKPNSVKGNYLKTVHVTTSMGPSIAVAISEL